MVEATIYIRSVPCCAEIKSSKLDYVIWLLENHFLMALYLGFLLWIIILAPSTLGNDHFINPPDLSSQTGSFSSYPVYAVGDILDISWVTAAAIVDLVINQLNSPVTEIDRTPNSGE
jgi:hypothetical protein